MAFDEARWSPDRADDDYQEPYHHAVHAETAFTVERALAVLDTTPDVLDKLSGDEFKTAMKALEAGAAALAEYSRALRVARNFGKLAAKSSSVQTD